MRFVRSVGFSIVGALLVACDDGATAPEAAVFGTFGGDRLQMTATREFLHIQTPCFPLVIEDVFIAPDVQGHFTIAETLVPSYGRSAFTVALSGRVDGNRIDATVRITSPTGATTTEHSLMRGERGDFSDIACLAS